VGPENLVRLFATIPRGICHIADAFQRTAEGLTADWWDGPPPASAALFADVEYLRAALEVEWAKGPYSDLILLESLDVRIAQRIDRERNQPEGFARLAWVYLLICGHRVPGARIDIEVPAGAGRAAERPGLNPVRADIVVYRDSARTTPWYVVEVKALGARGGFMQAQSYARNLGAEFFAVVRGDHWRNIEVFRTGLYGAPSELVEEGLPEA